MKKEENAINNNALFFPNTSKVSDLEKEYISYYGTEFVEDLKAAYLWMRKDMLEQPPKEEIRERRLNRNHVEGEWRRVCFVDFPNECLYEQTIDELGEKTLYNFGCSPRLRKYPDTNIRYLLSGMFLYDAEKTRKWLSELLGPGERFWYMKD